MPQEESYGANPEQLGTGSLLHLKMNWFKGLFLTTSLFILRTVVSSQTHSDTLTLLIGKWNVCEDSKFNQNFQCKKGKQVYEFFSIDSCKVSDNHKIKGEGKQYLSKWRLIGKTLVIDVPRPNAHSMPLVETYKNITWFDKNLFYSKMCCDPDNHFVYYYFQRQQ